MTGAQPVEGNTVAAAEAVTQQCSRLTCLGKCTTCCRANSGPKPNWEPAFHPQLSTLPSTDTARLWPSPAATCTQRWTWAVEPCLPQPQEVQGVTHLSAPEQLLVLIPHKPAQHVAAGSARGALEAQLAQGVVPESKQAAIRAQRQGVVVAASHLLCRQRALEMGMQQFASGKSKPKCRLSCPRQRGGGLQPVARRQAALTCLIWMPVSAVTAWGSQTNLSMTASSSPSCRSLQLCTC